MSLRFAIASKFEDRPVANDKVEHVIHQWSFLYASPDKEYVLVSVEEKGARVNEALPKPSDRGFRARSTNFGIDSALSENGNPSFATVLKVARALGVRLHAEAA